MLKFQNERLNSFVDDLKNHGLDIEIGNNIETQFLSAWDYRAGRRMSEPYTVIKLSVSGKLGMRLQRLLSGRVKDILPYGAIKFEETSVIGAPEGRRIGPGYIEFKPEDLEKLDDQYLDLIKHETVRMHGAYSSFSDSKIVEQLKKTFNIEALSCDEGQVVFSQRLTPQLAQEVADKINELFHTAAINVQVKQIDLSYHRFLGIYEGLDTHKVGFLFDVLEHQALTDAFTRQSIDLSQIINDAADASQRECEIHQAAQKVRQAEQEARETRESSFLYKVYRAFGLK